MYGMYVFKTPDNILNRAYFKKALEIYRQIYTKKLSCLG